MTNTVATVTHQDWAELAATFPDVEPVKKQVTVIEVQVEEHPGVSQGGRLEEYNVFMQLDADSVEEELTNWCHKRFGVMFSVTNWFTTQNPGNYQSEVYDDEF